MKRKLLLLIALAILPLVSCEAVDAVASVQDTGIILLTDIGLIIGVAAILALIATVLRQPLIPAYIIAGIVIGPIGAKLIFGTALISDPSFVRALSELGITFLLFTVGIELDLSRLKDVGRAAILIGTAQVALTFALGLGSALLLGISETNAVYIGLVVAFSSTMVVIKILSDRDEIETLHGRIMLGILLMQDIIAVIVLSMISAGDGGFSLGLIASGVLRALGLFSFAVVVARFIAPKILQYVSKSTELVFLTALFFAFAFAFSSHILGFSTAIGGFLGGISLAVFPYNLEISNKIKPLRDFFAIMFFVSLGMLFDPTANLGAIIVPIIVLSVLVLLLKPLVITALCIATGYEGRTAFLSGMGLGQVSEFSLILAIGLFAIDPATPVFPLALIIAIVSISITPYLISYGGTLYAPFSGLFTRIERVSPMKKYTLENIPCKIYKSHIVVFGAHIMGMEVIETLQKLKKDFVVVDHNPEIIKKLIKRGIHSIYGDVEDPEVLRKVCLKSAKMVISTVPDEDDSLSIIKRVKKENPKTILFVTAKTIEHAIRFYREGADFIIHHKLLGGREASERLEAALKEGQKGVLRKKLEEIELLERKRRDEIVDRVDAKLLKQIDELKMQEKVEKSETLGEE